MLNAANSRVEGLPDEMTGKETESTESTKDHQLQLKFDTQQMYYPSHINLQKSENHNSLNGPAMINLLNSDIGNLIPEKLLSSKTISGYTEETTNINSNSFDFLRIIPGMTDPNFNVPFATQTEATISIPYTAEPTTLKSESTIYTMDTLTPSTEIPITVKSNLSQEREAKNKLKKLEADLKLVDEVQSILNGIKSGNHKVHKREASVSTQYGLCADTSSLFELNLKLVTKSPYESKKISGLGKILKWKQDADKCRRKRLADDAKKISALGKILQWKHHPKEVQRRKRLQNHSHFMKKRFLALRHQNF